MSQIHEIMLYACFGALTGLVTAEVCFLIYYMVLCIKHWIRKRREKKNNKEN